MQNRIRELRKMRGWSLQKLADRVNSTKSTIFDLERGATRLNTDWIEKLADVFGVKHDDIYGFDRDIQDEVEIIQDAVPDLTLSDYHITYLVKSDSLDQVGITRGMVIVVDCAPEHIKHISTGDRAIVTLTVGDATKLLLRQYLAPSILVTNSALHNAPVLNLRNDDAGVKGIIVGAYQQFRGKFPTPQP